MKQVKVNLGKRSYSIAIGERSLQNLDKGLQKVLPSHHLIFLTNRTLSKLYRKKVESSLGGHWNYQWIVIPEGEQHKNLKTMESIYHQLAKFKADRKTSLVALGGGVVGDMGGFAAASYLRGIPYVQVPTTLLAQVDSSVGGKTGVDLPSGKNLVGAFYQPAWVLIDTHFLKTLPQREFLCGLAEVIKYGIIWDRDFFNYLERNLKQILSLKKAALETIIKRSCEIKAAIVSKDEKESGLRSLLNFGHTLGHAIETLSGYSRIHHGEGVACGMTYASVLSYELGFCSHQDVERIKTLLSQCGLPTQWPRYSRAQYQKVMALDKKALGNEIRYVVTRGIGKAAPIKLKVEEIAKYL